MPGGQMLYRCSQTTAETLGATRPNSTCRSVVNESSRDIAAANGYWLTDWLTPAAAFSVLPMLSSATLRAKMKRNVVPARIGGGWWKDPSVLDWIFSCFFFFSFFRSWSKVQIPDTNSERLIMEHEFIGHAKWNDKWEFYQDWQLDFQFTKPTSPLNCTFKKFCCQTLQKFIYCRITPLQKNKLKLETCSSIYRLHLMLRFLI